MSRAGWIMLAGSVSLAAAVSAAATLPKLLVWNASASVPIGLYLVQPARHLEVSDLVVATAPEPLVAFLAARGYLPRSAPLLKRVLARPGQCVCRDGARITVDQIEVGAARAHDRLGRKLPSWQGCRTLAAGEIFLMNRQSGDSLDGRYFGPMPATAVTGRAVPLWTDETGDGRFVWRAGAR